MDHLKKIYAHLKEVFDEWVEDNAQTWAASVTFYTILSLSPLLVLAVAIAGFVFGEEAAQGELARQMHGIMGSAGAEVLQSTIATAGEPGTNKGLIATVVSLVLLFFGASKVFAELRAALNHIWSVKIDPDAGWKVMIQKRLAGFVMVLAVGFFLLVAIAASTFIRMLMGSVSSSINVAWFVPMLNYIVSFVITTLLFGALFKYVPDVKIKWRDVGFGAIWTAVFFTIGKFALGLYVGHGDLGSGYGAAGSLIVLLAWFYYSVQIFFVGAEFTQVHARHQGHRIEPDKHAVITERECSGAASSANPSTT